MNSFTFLKLCVGCFFLALNCQASQLHFSHVSLPQGLSQVSVNDISQDAQGFMWFATQEGLNRFDGQQFRYFKPNTEQSLSLSSPFIWRIGHQRETFSLVTANGIDHFSLPQMKVIQSQKENVIDNASHYVMYKDLLVADGTDWLAGQAGVVKLDSAGKVTVFPLSHSAQGAQLTGLALARDAQQGLWVSTQQGVFYKAKASRHFHPILAEPVGRQHVTALAQQGGHIWLATAQSLYVFGSNQSLKQHFLLADLGVQAPIQTVLQDSFGDVWLGTSKGLYRLDTTTAKAQRIYLDERQRPVIVSALFEDKQANLWIGTQTQGAYKLAASARYLRLVSDQQGLTDNIVMAVVPQQGSQALLFTGSGGMNRLSSDGRVTLAMPLQNSVGNNLGIIIDAIEYQQHIWLAGDFGIARVKLDGTDLTAFPVSLRNGEQEKFVSQIFNNDQGLWAFGLSAGLLKFDEGSQSFKPHRVNKSRQDKVFLGHVIRAIVHQDDIYLATRDHQLLQLNTLSWQVNTLPLQDSQGQALPLEGVYDLLLDREVAQLWIAARSGLYRYDLVAHQIQKIEQQKGAPEHIFYQVKQDNAGFIWTASGPHLLRIDPRDLSISRFDAAQGMAMQEFNAQASALLANGQLVMGGIDGALVFHPEQLASTQLQGQASITEIEVKQASSAHQGEYEWQRRSVALTDNRSAEDLRLASDAGIRLHFSDFSFAGNSAYRYQLLPQDNNWNYLKLGQQEVTFQRLAPGRHEFILQSQRVGSSWQHAAGFQFYITPKFYQTWWFKLTGVMALVLLLLLAVMYRTARLSQRNRMLAAMVEQRTEEVQGMLAQRTRLFSNVSHEFRTPLSLILAPLTDALNEQSNHLPSEQIMMMKRNATRLLAMTDKLLRLTQLKPVSERHSCSVDEVIKLAQLQYQDLAEHNDCGLVLSGPKGLWVACGSEDLQLILFNLLSNAIKYSSGGGAVKVTWLSQAGTFRCKVEDQGDGLTDEQMRLIFEPFFRAAGSHSATGSGLGLTLVKETLQVLSGEITVTSALGEGTCFAISLPLTQACEEQAGRPLCQALSQESEPLPETNKQAPTCDIDTAPILLVVEDNPELAQYLAQSLSDSFKCILAYDGLTALQLANEQVPDVILSDWYVPELNGLQLCQQLKESPQTCHIPVVLLTANACEKARNQALQHQVTDVIFKPFDLPVLKLKLQNLAELMRSYASLQGQQHTGRAAHLAGSGTPLLDKDIQLLDKLANLLEARSADSEFNVGDLADALYMSNKQLQRKVKALTGLTPNEMLREQRLTLAQQHLMDGASMAQVAQLSGFNSQSYFTTLYKNRYGVTPKKAQSQLLKTQASQQNSA
ncbi:hybrid sensor histidine kinase/response regulator transcription factor [Motilimonas pumila]|uniref:histidine kinase n=1 Tax=Motilimonas pumila TaxID=2303987 RepID=A0A418YBD7_9GAMM|nr:ATP-binding protein [Motilimonas pumila]RJG40300.1 hybrid sensor histidine kinase/response regulator [Motilimonas pumila]